MFRCVEEVKHLFDEQPDFDFREDTPVIL